MNEIERHSTNRFYTQQTHTIPGRIHGNFDSATEMRNRNTVCKRFFLFFAPSPGPRSFSLGPKSGWVCTRKFLRRNPLNSWRRRTTRKGPASTLVYGKGLCMPVWFRRKNRIISFMVVVVVGCDDEVFTATEHTNLRSRHTPHEWMRLWDMVWEMCEDLCHIKSISVEDE